MLFKPKFPFRLAALCVSVAFAFAPAVISVAAHKSYSETLREVASGNRSLQALSLAAEASKAENLSGLNLSNPQVDFAYQWGTPTEDKVILEVSQDFDLATLSGAKKAAARSDNRVADAALVAERMKVLAETDLLMAEIVYLQKVENLYSRMQAHSEKILEVMRKALSEGKVTALEVNTARMDLASLIGERKVNAVDLANAMSRLTAMAGGNLDWSPSDYMPYEMPVDFLSYAQEAASRNPELAKASEEVAAADRRISLRRREGLPDFSLGYTSEMVRNDNHYGFSVGVALPLWGNHGRVKAAKAARAAAEAAAEDVRFQADMNLRSCFDKAVALGEVAKECRELAAECDNSAALGKLHELGQLSAEEYLGQLTPLFSLERRVIDADYAWQRSLAEFRAAGAAY